MSRADGIRRSLADALEGDSLADRELAAIRAAILLESAFEIRLTDREIDPALLCDLQAVVALVEQRLGGVA